MMSDFAERPLASLYAEHVAEVARRYERAMAASGVGATVIYSGAPRTAFLDDGVYPFRANPHFNSWLPLPYHAHCALLLRPDARPLLFYYQAEDYWHQPAADPSGFWTDHFEIERVDSPAPLEARVSGINRLAWIGEDADLAERCGASDINPEPLLDHLHFERAYKSGYEKRCILEASRLGVRGHVAAARCFAGGGSEFDIQHAFLAASGQREQEAPYSSIVGINEHAAVLHYQHYDAVPPADGLRSMLIDAGARFHGYACDITRTHAAHGGDFADLIDALDAEQRALIASIAPGVSYVDLHLEMHRRIASLLRRIELTTLDEETLLEENLTFTFMPHGLGHLLGLQTHDVGGHLEDRAGTLKPPPGEHPALRMTRPVEPDQVFTIEPGIYFIPSLLEQLRSSPNGSRFDWERIGALAPFGGIRIEDNVCVEADGVVNLTRACFAELGDGTDG